MTFSMQRIPFDSAPPRRSEMMPQLPGATRQSTLSVRVVHGLLDTAEEMGVPRAELIRIARLDPVQLERPEGRVSRADMYRLVEHALDQTGDSALGLHWAERYTENTFVPISHLIAHAPNLRQAVESLTRFFRLIGDEPSFEVSEADDKVTVRCRMLAGEAPRMQRFSAEMLMAGFFRLVRRYVPHARMDRVSFVYPAPTYEAEYTRFFETPVRFGQPSTSLVFARSLLDVPMPHNDKDVHEALRELAQRRLLRITQRTPYALRVRELLVQQGSPRSDMDQVARALGISPRSLRRRLAAEGKSYQSVVNEALAVVAENLLRDPLRTIQEVAYEMGFSDASAFHRAFKRWTGITPRSYLLSKTG